MDKRRLNSWSRIKLKIVSLLNDILQAGSVCGLSVLLRCNMKGWSGENDIPSTMQSPHIKPCVLSLSSRHCWFSPRPQWTTIPIIFCYFHFILAELHFASWFCTVHRVDGWSWWPDEDEGLSPSLRNHTLSSREKGSLSNNCINAASLSELDRRLGLWNRWREITEYWLVVLGRECWL